MAEPAVGHPHPTTTHTDGLPWLRARSAARELGERLRPQPDLVPLDAALGTVLAEGLRARTDVPVADASAMDGYAVRGEGPWQVVGRVLAGGRPAAALTPGLAVEVATGALVPGGTDRVVPVEDVRLRGDRVELSGDQPSAPRRHVRPRGEECHTGEELLPAGVRVDAAVLGLAAGTGSDELLVRPRPTVAALVTGDEIVTRGEPSPGQVRDAVGPLLPGAVAVLGGHLVAVNRSGDDVGELSAALDGLLELGTDVVVTCGMAGAGPADRLRPWLAEVGAALLVDGVAVRPGHPQVLAVLPDGRPLVGLPGNPLAAVSALLGLLGPLLDGASGVATTAPRTAALVGWEPRGRPVTTLLPVRLGSGGSVEPVGRSGPAQLRGLAAADAVAVVPVDWDRRSPVELLPAF